jgi:hypothetical protein
MLTARTRLTKPGLVGDPICNKREQFWRNQRENLHETVQGTVAHRSCSVHGTDGVRKERRSARDHAR